jgi:predicted MFS family arabinose efflux permease
VFALAAAQLVSWGSIYYSFSLFVVPMERELGWSLTTINGALSAGLMLSGLAAYPVGAWIDRVGGRVVMSAGSALGAVLLLAWSRLSDVGAFYAVWMGLGIALAATLYEPVFAVVTRLHPENYRTRITALTLVGGFASTVFIPLTAWAIGRWGWRDALVALALANVAVSLPVHLVLLRDRTVRPASAAPAQPRAAFDPAFRRALHHPAFWALAVSFTAYGATLSALTFHIIPLLEERHVPTAIMLTAIAMFGPAQVAGRVALLALGRRATAVVAGRIAFAVYPVAVLVLLRSTSTPALFLFFLLFGGANGVVTVVRGTAVPELLWRESYGAVTGALTLPTNLARAAAPWGAAVLWSVAGGYDVVLWATLAVAAVAAAGFWYATFRGERR